MRKQRYKIYDTAMRRFLRDRTVFGDAPETSFTRWTRDPDRALKLPGVKSARAMADRIVGGSAVVINAKGEIVA